MQDVLRDFCRDWGLYAILLFRTQPETLVLASHQHIPVVDNPQTQVESFIGDSRKPHEWIAWQPVRSVASSMPTTRHAWYGGWLQSEVDDRPGAGFLVCLSDKATWVNDRATLRRFLNSLRLLMLYSNNSPGSHPANTEEIEAFAMRVAAKVELDSIFRELLDAAARMAPVDAFLAGILMPDRCSVDLAYVYDEGRRYPRVVEKLGHGLLHRAVRELRSVRVHRKSDQPEENSDYSTEHGFGNKNRKSLSLLAVPILSLGQPIGVISFQSYQKEAFPDSIVRYLERLVREASTAIVRALHYQEQQRRTLLFTLVDEIHRLGWDGMERRSLIWRILDLFARHFPDCALGFFWRHGSPSGWQVFVISEKVRYEEKLSELPISKGIFRSLFETQRSVIDSGGQTDALLARLWKDHPRSVLLSPLLIDQQVAGIFAISKFYELAFSSQDARWFEVLLARVGLALAHYEFMNRLRRERNELMAILDRLQIGVHILDENRDLQFCNTWTREHLIQDPNEKKCYRALLGRSSPCPQCPLQNDADFLEAASTEYTDDNGRTYMIQLARFHTIDGQRQYLEVIIDRTRDRRLEEERARVEQLETVMAVAGAISHELNQPLTGVMGLISLILEDLEPDHQYYAQLREIENQAVRIRELVRRFQNITRVEKMRYLGKEIVDLRRSTG